MVSARLTSTQYNRLLEMLEEPITHPIEQPSSSACLVGKCSLVQSSSWILDTGATDHMCSDPTLFDTNRRGYDKNHFITLPDGRKV